MKLLFIIYKIICNISLNLWHALVQNHIPQKYQYIELFMCCILYMIYEKWEHGEFFLKKISYMVLPFMTYE